VVVVFALVLVLRIVILANIRMYMVTVLLINLVRLHKFKIQ